jgi:hypothetical protein
MSSFIFKKINFFSVNFGFKIKIKNWNFWNLEFAVAIKDRGKNNNKPKD